MEIIVNTYITSPIFNRLFICSFCVHKDGCLTSEFGDTILVQQVPYISECDRYKNSSSQQPSGILAYFLEPEDELESVVWN